MIRIAFFSLLCVLMMLFMAVQYNDPDGLMWIAIYAVPAGWCAIAAIRPGAFQRTAVYLSFLASVMAAVAGVIYFWPLTPRFWSKEVWYEVETAREGMGLMIVALILGMCWLVARYWRSGAEGLVASTDSGAATGRDGVSASGGATLISKN